MTRFFYLIVVALVTINLDLARLEEEIQPRLAGNVHKASSGQFPWTAKILHYAMESYMCSGAIIDSQWVVTLASCLNLDFGVSVGVGSLNVGKAGTIIVKSELLVPHPKYDNSNKAAYNIGLIKLSQKLVLSNEVQPIKLQLENLKGGVSGQVSSWGFATENGNLSDTLQYVTLTSTEQSDCQNAFPGKINDNVFCAQSDFGRTGLCTGDMGSPFVINLTKDPILAGLGTFYSSEGCASGKPSGLTRISPYSDWIISTIEGKPHGNGGQAANFSTYLLLGVVSISILNLSQL